MRLVQTYDPVAILKQVERLKEMYTAMKPYEWEMKVRYLELFMAMSARRDIPGTREAEMNALLSNALRGDE